MTYLVVVMAVAGSKMLAQHIDLHRPAASLGVTRLAGILACLACVIVLPSIL